MGGEREWVGKGSGRGRGGSLSTKYWCHLVSTCVSCQSPVNNIVILHWILWNVINTAHKHVKDVGKNKALTNWKGTRILSFMEQQYQSFVDSLCHPLSLQSNISLRQMYPTQSGACSQAILLFMKTRLLQMRNMRVLTDPWQVPELGNYSCTRRWNGSLNTKCKDPENPPPPILPPTPHLPILLAFCPH